MTKKEASSINKAKLVLLIGIPLLLVLSLALVFGKKQYREEEMIIPQEEEQEAVIPEGYPVEPEEKAQARENSVNEFKRTKRTTASGIDQNTGKPWKVTIIGDPNDPNWQMYKPQDVRVDIDKENITAVISWTESELPAGVVKRLVGFWSRTFDPIESFQRDRIPKDRMITWQGINKPADKETRRASGNLVLNRLPQPANTLYYAIYIRTGSLTTLPKEPAIDYIYGSNNSSQAPFSKSLN